MIKAVIFDFDGTLADTLPVCFHAFRQVFKDFDQKDLSDTDIKSMFGPSETGIIRNNLTHPDKDKAIELYYEHYTGCHSGLVENNKEIDDLINQLKNKGMKLGIVTGKARRSLDISLKELGMENLFDAIITGDDVTEPKPHPEGILKALGILNVNNSDAVFVGDSDADIQAGIDAGVFTVGVHWLPEFQTSEFSARPDAYFTSVRDFLTDLDKKVN